jgi:hypothetical protein
MKYLSTTWFLGLSISLMAAISANNQSASATVLTFDFGGGFSPNYGDNVSSLTFGGSGSYGAAGGFTPNVVTDYLGSVGNWPSGYGNLTNIIYEVDSGGIMNVKLLADPGYAVSLDSFNLAAFGTNYSINSVQVLDTNSSALYSASNVLISSSTFTDFDFSSSPLVSPSLTIRFDASNLGFDGDNIALDNVQFSQLLVPEPQSIALAILAGLSFIFLRRKWRYGTVR